MKTYKNLQIRSYDSFYKIWNYPAEFDVRFLKHYVELISETTRHKINYAHWRTSYRIVCPATLTPKEAICPSTLVIDSLTLRDCRPELEKNLWSLMDQKELDALCQLRVMNVSQNLRFHQLMNNWETYIRYLKDSTMKLS